MDRTQEIADGSRREFLSTCLGSLAGLSVVAIVAPILGGCSDSPTTSVPSGFEATFDVSSLDADGKALVTSTNGADDYPIAIIRASATSYTALSMRCTHEACEVNAPQGTSITCSCHGSRFDLSGNVLNGPANSPLYKYVTTYDASARTVTVKSV